MSLIGTAGTQPAGAEDVCFLGISEVPFQAARTFFDPNRKCDAQYWPLCALRFAPSSQTTYSFLAASFYRRCRLSEIAPIRPFLNLTEEPKLAGMRSGLVMLTALLLSGSVAMAKQAPCAGDIKKLCAGIQPGEGRIKACIKSHLTNLSQTFEDRVLTVTVTGKLCKTDVRSCVPILCQAPAVSEPALNRTWRR
jgi:hypothetical protein